MPLRLRCWSVHFRFLSVLFALLTLSQAEQRFSFYTPRRSHASIFVRSHLHLVRGGSSQQSAAITASTQQSNCSIQQQVQHQQQKEAPIISDSVFNETSHLASPPSTRSETDGTATVSERNQTVSGSASPNLVTESITDNNDNNANTPNGNNIIIPDYLRRKSTLKKIALGGTVIYLLGTAHVSNDSSADVQALLNAVRPDAIFVELCDARTSLLERPTQQPIRTNTSSSSFMNRVRETMQVQGGSRLQAMSTVLLTSVQEEYANTLDVELGGEFRCAQHYWEEQPQTARPFLILGDRPLQLTLVRAWESLSWWPKTKVVLGLIWSSIQKPNKDEIRAWLASVLQEDSDVLTKSFQELKKNFPTLYDTIIEERDSWLAAKLVQTCRALARRGLHYMNHPTSTLVAIVGAGHVPGITQKLTQPSTNNQTCEQILSSLCETKKFANDTVVQGLIPVWVNEVTLLHYEQQSVADVQ
jgi:pheromone shutdown protein TraB